MLSIAYVSLLSHSIFRRFQPVSFSGSENNKETILFSVLDSFPKMDLNRQKMAKNGAAG
jgi:hypothetical protein